jgi:anti-anti-sigma factor
MEEFCIKREDETLYLKGAGRLTSQNSEAFKNTVYSFLGESPCRQILLDLSNCQYMDSTFLGIIVGFYKRMRIGDFAIVKPSREAMKHLHSMGIDRLVNIINDCGYFPHEMGTCDVMPTRDPEAILKAHKNLMDLSEENRRKFALLAGVLEKEVAGKLGLDSDRSKLN